MQAIVNILKPFIAPVLVPWIGALLTVLQSRYHIIYEPEAVAKISEGVVLAVCYIFAFAASAAGFFKVMLNKKLNRSNAATTELVQHGNELGKDLKGTTNG